MFNRVQMETSKALFGCGFPWQKKGLRAFYFTFSWGLDFNCLNEKMSVKNKIWN